MSRRKNQVIKLARTTRLVLRVFALGLVAVFGFLKLQGLPVGSALATLPGRMILRLCLAAYFASWVFGVLNDTNIQEEAYAVAPNRGRFPWQGLLASTVISIVFGILCWVDSEREFSTTLAVFLVVNVISWQYMIKKVIPSAYTRSHEIYTEEGDVYSQFFLDLVHEYLLGRWQWWRFAYGACLVVALCAFAFTRLPDLLAGRLPGVSSETLVSLTFLFFVLTFEGWIWYQRLRVRVVSTALRDFSRRYDLVPVGAAGSGTRTSA